MTQFCPKEKTGGTLPAGTRRTTVLLSRLRGAVSGGRCPNSAHPKNTVHAYVLRGNKWGIMTEIMVVLIEECKEAVAFRGNGKLATPPRPRHVS